MNHLDRLGVSVEVCSHLVSSVDIVGVGRSIRSWTLERLNCCLVSSCRESGNSLVEVERSLIELKA